MASEMKIKREVRTLAEKKEILAQYDSLSVSKKKASKILGLPEGTLRHIIQARHEIESVSSRRDNKCRVRRGQFPRVERAVTKWLNVAKERRLSFKRMEIMEKAGEFAKAFGFEHNFGDNWVAKVLDNLDFDYKEFQRENNNSDPMGNLEFMEKDIEVEIVKEVNEEFKRKAESQVKIEPAHKKIKKEKKPLEKFDFNNNNEEFEIILNEVDDFFTPEMSMKEQEKDEQIPSDAEALHAWKVVKKLLKGNVKEDFFREGDEAINKVLSKQQDAMAWNRIKSSLLNKGFDDFKLLKKFEESLMKP